MSENTEPGADNREEHATEQVHGQSPDETIKTSVVTPGGTAVAEEAPQPDQGPTAQD